MRGIIAVSNVSDPGIRTEHPHPPPLGCNHRIVRVGTRQDIVSGRAEEGGTQYNTAGRLWSPIAVNHDPMRTIRNKSGCAPLDNHGWPCLSF